MKMYHYITNEGEYFVLADNKISAHQSLIKQLQQMSADDASGRYQEELKAWKSVDVFDPKTFPQNYTLLSHDVGSVVEARPAERRAKYYKYKVAPSPSDTMKDIYGRVGTFNQDDGMFFEYGDEGIKFVIRRDGKDYKQSIDAFIQNSESE